MFEQSMIPKGKRKTGAMVFSIIGQLVAIGILILVPMMFVQVLPTADLEAMLVAPPPPPPPPPPPAAAPAVPHHVVPVRQFKMNALVAPTTIPKQIPVIQDPADTSAEAAATAIGGVPGGVPGGVAGGVEGGVLGSLLNSVPAPAPPPPPAPKPAAPAPPTPKMIHVGGNVEAAKLISGPTPAYPMIAREARVQGVVNLRAVIGKDGRVQNLTVTDGNPLLVNAALSAVRKWIYKPTYLNGVPVSVATEIEVTFHLG